MNITKLPHLAAAALLAASLGLGFTVVAQADGVHHPCDTPYKDLSHEIDTPVAGQVWLKAGPTHFNLGYHDAGWDVPATYAGKDTSHYDVCVTVTMTTTTVPPTTEPPTTPPPTTEPPTTPPPTTTIPEPCEYDPQLPADDPACVPPPTTGPAPTTTTPLVATYDVTGDCTRPALTVTITNPTLSPVFFYVFPTAQPTPVETPWRIEPNQTVSFTYELDVTVRDVRTGEERRFTLPEHCAPTPPTDVVVITPAPVPTPPRSDIADPPAAPAPSQPELSGGLPETGSEHVPYLLLLGAGLVVIGTVVRKLVRE